MVPSNTSKRTVSSAVEFIPIIFMLPYTTALLFVFVLLCLPPSSPPLIRDTEQKWRTHPCLISFPLLYAARRTYCLATCQRFTNSTAGKPRTHTRSTHKLSQSCLQSNFLSFSSWIIHSGSSSKICRVAWKHQREWGPASCGG